MVTTDGRTYAKRRAKINGKYTSQYMHSLITGYPLVDHINMNGLDNQRTNLRRATHSQNHANVPKRRGTSKYKGVYFHKKSGKWMARIKVIYVHRYLGIFFVEEEAARAYDKAALEYFGEFAYLNFPEEKEPSTD